METVAPGGAFDVVAASHYRLVAPAMEALFGPIPVVWTSFPYGSERAPQWHVHYFGHYDKLRAELIEHLTQIGAQEFYSWFPMSKDSWQARFMRLLLHHVDRAALKEAATVLRAALHRDGREALCLLDGLGNIELWSPLSDAPPYDSVRGYLHHFAARVVEKHGSLISLAPNNVDDGRAHLHVSNNAVGRWTIVPYCFRPATHRIATPISWDELAAFDIHGCTIGEFPERFRTLGDVFAKELAALPSAPPLPAQPVMVAAPPAPPRGERNAHGAVLQAALQLLADGKTRTAAQIEEEAVAAGLISKTPASTVDATLLEYLARCKQRGRKCLIVETPQRAFRLNEPPDEWPPMPISALPPLTREQQAVVDRLRATMDGSDPTAFEVAVCDAFTALGFAATHMGGWNAPDGYLDAQLGPLGYRVMLECKSGHAIHSAGVFEAAKYRDTYQAKYCVMVGTEPVNDQETLSELQNHNVSAWAVDDFETLLRLGSDALEMEALFRGGAVAADVLMDLQWERNHGEHKRVQIVADIIHSSAWAMQCAAVEAGPPQDAPVLNVDAAMLLVDQALLGKGCKVSCTRAQVQAAFNYLTSPLVNTAVWDAGSTGIVIRRS